MAPTGIEPVLADQNPQILATRRRGLGPKCMDRLIPSEPGDIMGTYVRSMAGHASRRGRLRERTAIALGARDALQTNRARSSVGVSVATAHLWTRDIEITAEQQRRNLGRDITADCETIARRPRGWATTSAGNANSGKRRVGRGRWTWTRSTWPVACCTRPRAPRAGTPAQLTNSDVHLVRFFRRFVSECFSVSGEGCGKADVYTGNGLSLYDIESYWLDALGLPRCVFRKHKSQPLPDLEQRRKEEQAPVRGLRPPSASEHTCRAAHLRRPIRRTPGSRSRGGSTPFAVESAP